MEIMPSYRSHFIATCIANVNLIAYELAISSVFSPQNGSPPENTENVSDAATLGAFESTARSNVDAVVQAQVGNPHQYKRQ